jgi:hypothetical protein
VSRDSRLCIEMPLAALRVRRAHQG